MGQLTLQTPQETPPELLPLETVLLPLLPLDTELLPLLPPDTELLPLLPLETELLPLLPLDPEPLPLLPLETEPLPLLELLPGVTQTPPTHCWPAEQFELDEQPEQVLVAGLQ